MAVVVLRRRLVWLAGLAAAAVALAATAGYAATVRAPGPVKPLVPVLRSVVTPKKVVALTFDDGPSPLTGRILDILKAHGARATFFVLGFEVERHPAVARRIVAEGHQLGNHTYSHRYLSRWPLQVAVTEVQRGEAAIRLVTGVRPRLFRFPGFEFTAAQATAVLQMGYTIVGIRVDSKDWRRSRSRESIINNVIKEVRPGDIVLLHDGPLRQTPTVAALPEILSKLRAAGYTFVTVGELMKIGRSTPGHLPPGRRWRPE